MTIERKLELFSYFSLFLAPFTWKQTLADVDLTYTLEKGIKAKEIKVNFTPDRIRVQVRGQLILEVISPYFIELSLYIQGDFPHKVVSEDCTWLLGWSSFFADHDSSQ